MAVSLIVASHGHVPLMSVEESVPWQSDEEAIRSHVTAGSCLHCAAIARDRLGILDLVDQAHALSPRLQEHERTMLRLQMEFRVIRGELSRAVKALREGFLAHPGCAACPILVGPGHVESKLVREPYGKELVCSSCQNWLKEAHVSAADQRRKGREYRRDDSD